MAAIVGPVRDVIGRALNRQQTAGATEIERNRALVVSPEKLKELI